jgi:tetratricopeptide (TPR) repeat protein
MARYFFDMGAYDADRFYSVRYDTAGTHYMDSALTFYPAGSFEKIYYNGLRRFKQGDSTGGGAFFEQLMTAGNLSDHQLALTASTLSGVYLRKGAIEKAIDLLARAAIADIRTATKETFAIFNLAELLYKKGDVKYASVCIENAIANAEFYNARQRKAQVSSILSIIENQRIRAIEAERRLAVQYGIAVTLFLAVLGVLIVVIRRQLKKLRAAGKIISEAHTLQQQVNAKLEEANKIKEEYIGYFFKLDSEYFARLERLKKVIEQKLADRKYEDIRFVLNNIQPRKEKEELLGNFDKVFLRIFPHFVTDFNSFFKEEDQVRLTDNELLNTDLRIFALIRIGITDNEKIAEILEYSVNTIYAYKTRIKNKSFHPNEDFEARVMEIRSLP